MPIGGTVSLRCLACRCETEFQGFPALTSEHCQCGHLIKKHALVCDVAGCGKAVRDGDGWDRGVFCRDHYSGA